MNHFSKASLFFMLLILPVLSFSKNKQIYNSESVGIEFKYLDKWKVDEKQKKGYQQVILSAPNEIPKIYLQKYDKKLTKNDFNKWIYHYRVYLTKRDVKRVKNTILQVSPEIKMKFKSHPIEGILYAMVFQRPDKTKYNCDVVFFNSGEKRDKGFIMVFIYDKKVNKEGVKLFQESLTLLK